MHKATILLDDGTRLEGMMAGVPGVTIGDLSVYTAHDYMHRITDPLAAGQICAFTMPVTGLWGVNTESCESGKPWVRGVIVRTMEEQPVNWRSAETLDYYLRRNLICAVTGIDTEALYDYAHRKGIRKCAIVSSPGFTGWDALLTQVKSYRYDNIFAASVKTPESYGPEKSRLAHFGICDFGASQNLAKLLAALRIRAMLLPPYDAATIIERGGYDALILPPGPGTPRNHPGITETLRSLIAENFPMLGMGLGCGFIAAAAGIPFARMSQPHRGQWLPVNDLETGRAVYTRQYHEYDFGPELPEHIVPTHQNALDGTLEGFRLESKPVMAVQFHPCADLRLGGTGDILRRFLYMVQEQANQGGKSA